MGKDMDFAVHQTGSMILLFACVYCDYTTELCGLNTYRPAHDLCVTIFDALLGWVTDIHRAAP